MRIKKITYKNRRDFKAIYLCENCGFEVEEWGYDDSNFHENVIPKMVCPNCKMKSGVVTSRATNPDWMQY